VGNRVDGVASIDIESPDAVAQFPDAPAAAEIGIDDRRSAAETCGRSGKVDRERRGAAAALGADDQEDIGAQWTPPTT